MYERTVDVDVFPVCFCPKSILCGARQAKTGLNMTAFAGYLITCFAAFSRVTRLAFAKELLVRISKKTLSIVQARFVDTNILVKKTVV